MHTKGVYQLKTFVSIDISEPCQSYWWLDLKPITLKTDQRHPYKQKCPVSTRVSCFAQHCYGHVLISWLHEQFRDQTQTLMRSGTISIFT